MKIHGKSALAPACHRLSNDLNLIHGLLGLARRRVGDVSAASMLESTRERVRIIALCYDQKFAEVATDFEQRFDPAPLVRQVAGEVQRKHASHDAKTELVLSLENVGLEFEQLVPVLLMARELLANAFEHGVGGEQARKVELTLTANGANGELVVRDDGRGLVAGHEQRRERRLGLALVRMLSEQLGGELGEPAVGAASVWAVRFPLER